VDQDIEDVERSCVHQGDPRVEPVSEHQNRAYGADPHMKRLPCRGRGELLFGVVKQKSRVQRRAVGPRTGPQASLRSAVPHPGMRVGGLSRAELGFLVSLIPEVSKVIFEDGQRAARVRCCHRAGAK
jgi:hypothetical protein